MVYVRSLVFKVFSHLLFYFSPIIFDLKDLGGPMKKPCYMASSHCITAAITNIPLVCIFSQFYHLLFFSKNIIKYWIGKA